MFKIVNKNSKMPDGSDSFIGRHNGIDYEFPHNQPVYCPDDAAKHIFAIGDPDKSSAISRWGWAPPTATLAQGMKVLNAFAFEYMAPVFDAPMARVERKEPEEDDHGPAPVVQDALAGEAEQSAFTAGAVAARQQRPVRLPPAA